MTLERLIGVAGLIYGPVGGPKESLAVGVAPEVDPGFDRSISPTGVGLQLMMMSTQGSQIAFAGSSGFSEGADVVEIAGLRGSPTEREHAGLIAKDH